MTTCHLNKNFLAPGPDEQTVTLGQTDLLPVVEAELTRLFPQRAIRRVLLVAPPDSPQALFDRKTARRGRYWNFPAYGLGLLAARLARDNIVVEILNLNHAVLKACRLAPDDREFDFETTWQNGLGRAIRRFGPDLMGLTCMFSQTHASAAAVAAQAKTLCPNLPVALGGVHITNCFAQRDTLDHLLKDFVQIDLFFLYEAELAFSHFVRAVNRQADPLAIHQVYFNTADPRLYFPARNLPLGRQLDTRPALKLMDIGQVSQYGQIGSFTCLKKSYRRGATLLSNRGCRGRCTYCSVRNFNGQGVRCRSVESVLDELKALKERFGVDHIMWLDDDLLFDTRRALSLFNEMVRANLGMTWDCTNGVLAASCSDEVVAAAAESGCIGLTIGVESGNPEILKKIRKPGTPDTFLKAARILKKHPAITSRVFLMFGFPDETFGMIQDTYDLARTMNLDWYNITMLQPLPNTPLFQSMQQQGLVNIDDAGDIRFNSGAYGKHRQKARLQQRPPFPAEIFTADQLERTPAPDEMDAIWMYLNFHLNFKRLTGIEDPLKLEQQLRYLTYITQVVAPDDPFPIYFCMHLQQKLEGTADNKLKHRLNRILASSAYWRASFAHFGLSARSLLKF